MSSAPDPVHVEQIFGLLLSGQGDATCEHACRVLLKLPDDQIPATMKAAKKRLRDASRFDPQRMHGLAVARLNQIFTKSMAAGDYKLAMATQRELNRMSGLGVADDPGDVDDPSAAESELNAVRAHLIPLGLADATYPLREHARLAAEKVRDAMGVAAAGAR